MDTLILKECRFLSAIGITPEERAQKQEVIIDVEFPTDTGKAAASDRIEDTVDYFAVYEAMKELVESQEFNLVEAMGEAIARRIFERFPVSEVTLTVRKTKPMEGRGAWAGVRMTRTRPR
jgi:dihydroneopterin aldolase